MVDAPWWKNSRGEWYVVAQVGIFALVAIGPRALPGWAPWPAQVAGIASGAGLVLLFAGGFLALGGLMRLGPNLSVLPFPKECAELVQTGAYGIVRHTIYSGLIVGAFGWALTVHGTLTVVWAFVLLVFFDMKSRLEERWLSEKFPGYSAYRKRVKKLIPWLY